MCLTKKWRHSRKKVLKSARLVNTVYSSRLQRCKRKVNYVYALHSSIPQYNPP